MKVLISDNLGEVGIDRFQQEPECDVDITVGLPPEELTRMITEYDALVIRSATNVTEELLAAAKNLKVIGKGRDRPGQCGYSGSHPPGYRGDEHTGRQRHHHR